MEERLLEPKKVTKLNFHTRSSLFLSIGLTVSLLAVTIAFEWRVYDMGHADLGKLEDEFEELIDVPLTQHPPPPPPPVFIPPEIIEVPDDEEIEEDIMELDVDMTEDMDMDDMIHDAMPQEDMSYIFDVVEEPGSPVGGVAALSKYLSSTLRYPRAGPTYEPTRASNTKLYRRNRRYPQ